MFLLVCFFVTCFAYREEVAIGTNWNVTKALMGIELNCNGRLDKLMVIAEYIKENGFTNSRS